MSADVARELERAIDARLERARDANGAREAVNDALDAPAGRARILRALRALDDEATKGAGATSRDDV